MNLHTPGIKESVTSETGEELREPPMYKVLLHNDDYTTMDFVVEILSVVFNKSAEDATKIMLKVHVEGLGVCGLYTFEVAETKLNTVHVIAAEKGFPLKCTMEEE
ncbi:MAG: ATP-dependent Clp protease adapter ClpS [Deltaproteobacteria bacterium]|nr:ATP-dependent Clp protease adapter ClpS [Deltaproteobacteria bacterium]MBW2011213.1 ATP-dependent Clp protease adapter ClpS [Deltaproteobacteria bacterium]MBW2100945.1 ATP-dependent Clp protease adapter ClpS [Deltaproteobacteria bacterium]